MSRKISDFFKIDTKNKLSSNLDEKSLVEVKIEMEASFEINLDEIEPKVSNFFSHLPANISKDTQNEGIENLKIIKSEIKADDPQNNKRTLKTVQVECKFCSSIMVKESVPNHIKKFHPEHVQSCHFICQICDQELKTIISFKGHMTKMHPETASEPKHFECDFDGKIFKTRTKILYHMKCHQSKVKCKICQIEVQSLQRHIISFHTNERNYQCQICQKSFKRIDTLKCHIQRHNKNFECTICSKLFPSQGTLNSHMKIYHENLGSFECQICSRKFNQKIVLKRHQKTHEKNRPKPYKCQRCSYATDIKIRLKTHTKIHEKQDKKLATMKNPFKCEKCSACLKNSLTLKQHMTQVHPDQLFQCDLCGKYIKTKQSLAKHIKKIVCQKMKVLRK